MKFASRKDEILYGIALSGADAFRSYDDGSSVTLVRGPIRIDPPFADVVLQDALYLKKNGIALQDAAYVILERSDGIVEVSPMNSQACIEAIEKELDGED